MNIEAPFGYDLVVAVTEQVGWFGSGAGLNESEVELVVLEMKLSGASWFGWFSINDDAFQFPTNFGIRKKKVRRFHIALP